MSKVLTVRVTVLEAFRQWVNSNDEDDNKPWICEANVIKSVQGEYTGSVKADYGTSGHNIIEDSAKYRVDGGYRVTVVEKELAKLNTAYVPNSFTFTDTQAGPLLKYIQAHPLMVRETPVSKAYEVNGVTLIVTGTIDGIEGINVHDNKFKFSSFTMDEYMDSAQWRLYLDMIGLDIFYYDFFKVSRFNGIEDTAKSVIGECESLMVTRYPDMDRDIQSLLAEFMEWATFKGLTPYLAITNEKRKRILAGDSRLKKLIG